ncbi:MAG: Hemoprotein HemQ, essential component of heme biosynthetic pathway in Gram-positive bacteria, partial [uncultured Gemmatimonadaceae bacterium]
VHRPPARDRRRVVRPAPALPGGSRAAPRERGRRRRGAARRRPAAARGAAGPDRGGVDRAVRRDRLRGRRDDRALPADARRDRRGAAAAARRAPVGGARPGLHVPERHRGGALPRDGGARAGRRGARRCGGRRPVPGRARGAGARRAGERARAQAPVPAAPGRPALRLLLPDVEAARRGPELVRAHARRAQPPDAGARDDRAALRGASAAGDQRRDRVRRVGVGRDAVREGPARLQADRDGHAVRRGERAVRGVRGVLRGEGDRARGVGGPPRAGGV